MDNKNYKNFDKKNDALTYQNHSFHLVDPSPWPLISGISGFMLTFGFAMYMHGFEGGSFLVKLGLISIIYMMYCWWGDIVREGTIEGQHTSSVQVGLKLGVILFILSEVMFFFAFFWAFFHSSFNPNLAIGGIWPPSYIVTLNPWKLPVLNTIILLSSGATVTWAHHSIIAGKKKEAEFSLIITIVLALVFTLIQGYEYYNAPFTISDSVYGSTFFMATGFHGFHVIIGTTFLFICFLRIIFNQFTREHHFGFEAAAWYWHFVDVVWLFLFITIYWWGS